MTEQSHTVFLSYASQDAPAAQRICEALRAGGIEVWFDQSELRGGDAWDQSIRRQIKSCALFIAVISKSTNDRDEGYFRLEWKLAVDRSHLMAADRTFLLPVVVDGTHDDDDRVPEHFREVQWTHLPGGETPAVFVERVRRLLAPADPHAPAVRHEATRPLSAAPPPAKTVAQVFRSKRGPFLVAAGALLAVVALLASGYFMRRNTPTAAVTAAPSSTPRSTPFNPPAGTLVVLPFKNLNGDPKQQYFSDGITEELTDALGQNPGLRVIAWDTASKLRDSAQAAGEIGKQLNVANLLHGSIEREGNQVRVTAELVDTRSGLQVWSQHYDGAFADIFKVQDQVSTAIADALNVKIAKADLPQVGTNNPEAHELVLRGRSMEGVTATALAAQQKLYEQAIALDPDYAEAHALLASTLLAMTARANLPLKTALPRIRAEAERAVALDPRNAYAWLALGSAEDSTDPPNAAKAREDYRKALALDPSNAAAHLDYGTVLPLQQNFVEMKKAAELDPTDETAWNNLAVFALELGDWKQEIKAAEMLNKLDPKFVDSAFALAFAYLQLHQYGPMVAAFDRVQPSTSVDQAQVAAGRLSFRAIVDPSLRPQALAALQTLARNPSNPDVTSNVVLLYLVLGETAPTLDQLANLCQAAPIACGDLAANPMYRPLHGNPRFEALAKKYTNAAPSSS